MYNTQALRWLLPMEEPFSELETLSLSQMYDAEVAFQDYLLSSLLNLLSSDYHRENTAVIVVADHGEMLGEEQLMGHGFSVHEELVRVPLFIRLPGQRSGRRIREVVSTTQLFHTVLDLAKVEDRQELDERQILLESLSLKRFEPARTAPFVFSEAFPPSNVIKIMEKKAPDLIGEFSSLSTFRAVYNQTQDKLVQIEGHGEQLFNLAADPMGRHGVADEKTAQSNSLVSSLSRFVDSARLRQPKNWSRSETLLSDKKLRQRLQKLGYLD